MRKLFILISLFYLMICGFVTSKAQIKISLKIDESEKSFIGSSLFCDDDYKCGLFLNEKAKLSNFGANKTPIKVWRTGEDFLLLIDTNQNNKLSDEKKILLKKEANVTIKIHRKIGAAKTIILPFTISHRINRKGENNFDGFQISPHYSARGILKYKKCEVEIRFADMNLDGKFDSSDAERGTNFQIDKNNDGKFWGKEEYAKSNEIIDFCGQNFLVSAISSLQVTLKPTQLRVAKIGEIVPNFSIVLLNGETITAKKMRGKVYILDFWASWCIPCVENLPQIKILKKEFANRISIFSINVDNAARKKLANKIILDQKLFDFSSIRGLGEKDSVWQTFGGENLNRMAIPLYVLVDKNGIVRYSDDGGENLNDLKESVLKLPTD